MQVPSSQLTKGSSASGHEGPPPTCQLTNRKARSTKQLDLQSQSLGSSSLPHRGICPDEAGYANLLGAMDNDLDRPESLSTDTLQEQNSQSIQSKGTHHSLNQRRNSVDTHRLLKCVVILFAVLESKGRLRKVKAQKKKEEKEKKSTVKTQGDDIDDNSSTTTETSNPDMEPNLKEVHANKSSIAQLNNSLLISKTICITFSRSQQKGKEG